MAVKQISQVLDYKMAELRQQDSEGEIGLETLISMSSDSSTSSSSSSNSTSSSSSTTRMSFEIPSSHSQALKPHRSSDSGWEAIRSATFHRKDGLNFRDFKIIRQIGSGDIGNVYLCRLNNTSSSCSHSYYAMKVVDKEALAMKKKTGRAETEKRILKMLDHPFLPTLYSDFEVPKFSCVVMEFCSGGDLHSLRHKLPGKRFSLSSARFYAAEVLVALEYIHMLGIIYRDLKPENVLVRCDGHIMLSDFDLSLCSNSIPALELPLNPSSPNHVTKPKRQSLLPIFSCFSKSSIKVQTFVAEPVSARSNSFVGTHEYVAPEVAAGKSHGNAVDWWAFGIFIYELIYGVTPFSGETNEVTLRNILKKPLVFPKVSKSTREEYNARELIKGLLVKDPDNRLGSKRGAADVKIHPFFKGVNFALLRSCPPPAVPPPPPPPFARSRSLPMSSTTAMKKFQYF